MYDFVELRKFEDGTECMKCTCHGRAIFHIHCPVGLLKENLWKQESRKASFPLQSTSERKCTCITVYKYANKLSFLYSPFIAHLCFGVVPKCKGVKTIISIKIDEYGAIHLFKLGDQITSSIVSTYEHLFNISHKCLSVY